MLVFLSQITVAASDVDAYVNTRRSVLSPAMQEQPGYGGVALLRPRTGGKIVRLALLNWWDSAEDQRRWAGSATHGAMSNQTNHLVRSADTSVYEHADGLSLRIGDSGAATMISIGFHQAATGRSADYISARREIANPSMRTAPGFVGISVCRDPGDIDRFIAVLEWANDTTADTYYASAEHADTVEPAIRATLTRLEPGKRYDVLMRDNPLPTV